MRRSLINQQCITPVLFVSMLVAWLYMPDVAVTFAPVYMLFILSAYGVPPVVRVDVMPLYEIWYVHHGT
jgi:hypothetical protein